MNRQIAITLSVAALAPSFALIACGDVPSDPIAAGGELVAAGVIQGSALYSGPHPCSKDGHIVGSLIVFAFDYNNQPPPNGTASTPVNFTVIAGDALFPNESRSTGTTTYCPLDHGNTEMITATGDYTITPMNAGRYVLQSFYDYTGNFLPSFKFRDLPEMGDIGGGHIDLSTTDGGTPPFLPVTVGVPDAKSASGYSIPPNGFLAEGVSIVVGQRLTMPRPYMTPQGESLSVDDAGQLGPTINVALGPMIAEDGGGIPKPTGSAETDPTYYAVLSFSQDIQAAPLPPAPTAANALDVLGATVPFEASLPHIRLNWGVPSAELAVATSPTDPFHLQVGPYDGTSAASSLSIWTTGGTLPGNSALASYWPQIALTKLIDPEFSSNPKSPHANDPESIIGSGSTYDTTPLDPIVLIQSITLATGSTFGESLLSTAAPFAPLGLTLQPLQYADHATGAILPLAVCFDPTDMESGGTLVTPYGGASSDPTQPGDIVDPSCFGTSNPSCQLVSDLAAQGIKVTSVVTGCLPKGRYAINAFYPDSQAWTTPNEAGSCSVAEGTTDYGKLTCSAQPRPILPSQGNHGVVEITGPTTSGNCSNAPGMVPPTPDKCLPCSERAVKPAGGCPTNF